MSTEEFVMATVDHYPHSTYDVIVQCMYYDRAVSVCVAKYNSKGQADTHAKQINDAIKRPTGLNQR